MASVILAFHPSVDLPDSAKGLVGTSIALESCWSVRQLASAIERHCAHNGVGVRACALINPARGCAAPPHEQAVSHFSIGDRAVVIGDVQASLWPAELAFKPRAPDKPVPITIFTGFLGSGKTTVLNHLLLHQREKKFAVIENEFGAVPIDNELLQNSALGMAEQVVVMENGCMCCTVRGDLLGAFDSIRKQMATGSQLDAVLVETTGMADPVPIVRTLRQTPDIARYFQLDGTITLVDTKTILSRLKECEGGKDDQERHKQLAFADKILLNKLDLVTDAEAVEVWRTIRSYNATAPIIGSVKGIVPAEELTQIGAFDASQIVAEQADSGHGHGHGGGHGQGGHECDDDCDEHGHGGGHEDHGGGHGTGHGRGHGHGHSSRHDSAIGSFSIVRKGMEVDPLAFARWVRIIATLPEEQGKLYRSKGVLAAVGRPAKLIFHAVSDVVETSDGPDWGEHEQRNCKMVFIGKKLDRKAIEERFVKLFQPVQELLRFPYTAPSPSFSSRKASLAMVLQVGAVHRALLGCWSKDVVRVSQVSAGFCDALRSPESLGRFQHAARMSLSENAPCGLQTVEGQLWLHAVLPLRSLRSYALAWRAARVTLATKSSVEHMWGEPLQFNSLADVEAAGVMWQELSEMNDERTSNFVVEFNWKPETMKSFFDVAGSATNSALVKICIEDGSGDSEMDDDLKFRVNLNPEANESQPGLTNHRLSLQLVGGKSSNYIYQIFFHTIDPTYQVHINVPDHRVPIFPTKEVFHQWHPLMAGLRKRPRLRFLLRCKSMDSGPLDAMCGCCG
mmetsp:Transcript_26919/g.60563  ORF Transcript_26919/g.60563 Transcript_26919/m.60563 type:complete len:792 (-) Transcript_26919:179-2554(-)